MARIFITYRREDSAAYAGRLYDQLVSRLGRHRVFMDIDGIEPGEDYTRVIAQSVGSAKVVIALIGRQWLSAVDEHGQRRLDKPEDLVRIEIAAALQGNARVIPVLVGHARMPQEKELPEILQPLARRNVVELSDMRFRSDVETLIRTLAKDLGMQTKVRLWAARPLPRVAAAAVIALGVWGIVLQFQRPATSGQAPTATQTERLSAPAQLSDKPVDAATQRPSATPAQDSVAPNRSESSAPGAVPSFVPPGDRRSSLGAVIQNASGVPGALVTSLRRDGAADRAGLRAGDVISAIDGQAVADATEVFRLVGAKPPGRTIAVSVRRGERERVLNVELQAWDIQDLRNATDTINENYDVTAREAIRKINQ
jgi:hypothetical protein